jgi:hypothetical protein
VERTDTVTYKLYDGQAYSNLATVSFNVTNTAPVAVGDGAYSVVHRKTLSGIDLKANDSDADADYLSLGIVQGPSHGYLYQDYYTGTWTYSAYSSYAGPDSFTYKLNDGAADSNIATVSINVTNNAPVAGDDGYTVLHGQSLSNLDLKANDSDADGDSTSVQIVGNAQHSYLYQDWYTGKWNYSSYGNFVGTDTATYKLYDGQAYSNLATVSINVASSMWDGGGDGSSWMDPHNWTGDLLPGANDDVYINATQEVVLNGEANIRSLTSISALSVQAQASLSLAADSTVYGQLDSVGQLTVQSGILSLAGAAELANSILLAGANAQLRIQNNVTLAGDITGEGLVRVSGALTVDAYATIANLRLETYGTVQGTGTIEITDTMTWTGGKMIGTGTTLIGADAVLTIPDNYSSLGLEDGRTLRNEGTVSWAGESQIYTSNATAKYENAAGAVWNIGANGTLSAQQTAEVVFENEGTLTKTGNTGMMQNATVFAGVALHSAGDIAIQTGTIRLEGGGELGGLVTIASGAQLRLAAGTFTSVLDASFTGLGAVVLGALVPAPALPPILSIGAGRTYTVSHFSLMPDGYIDGQGTLVITEEFLWTGGVMRGTGRTEINPGAAVAISGANAKLIDGRFVEIKGQTDAAGASIQVQNEGRIENYGVFAIHDSFGLALGAGAGFFINRGTFRKTESFIDAVTAITIQFENSDAEVEIVTGIVEFRGLYAQTGDTTLRIGEFGEVRAWDMIIAGGKWEGEGILRLPGSHPGALLTWVEGAIDSKGKLILEPDTSMKIPGAITINDAAFRIVNEGTIQWFGAEDFVLSGTLENRPGGLFEIDATGGNGKMLPNNDAFFLNQGILRKIDRERISNPFALPGATEFRVNYRSELVGATPPRLETLVGTLDFYGQGDHAGVIDSDSWLTWRADQVLRNGLSLQGAGGVAATDGKIIRVADGATVTSTSVFGLGDLSGTPGAATLTGNGCFASAESGRTLRSG